MKSISWERIFICVASLLLNKVLLFWLIGTSNLLLVLVVFGLLVCNFIFLAHSVDKLIAQYEKSKKKQARPHIEMEIEKLANL